MVIVASVYHVYPRDKNKNDRENQVRVEKFNTPFDHNFAPKISDFGLAKLCAKDQTIYSMNSPRAFFSVTLRMYLANLIFIVLGCR